MPKLKIDRVLSFSSEDPVHPASNLLSPETSKKWKCRTAGEKSASVILQLEKVSLISGIDIGNEHSAYVEVLVSRSAGNGEFKPLLAMSSFMTPLEARQGTNINKVRMFSVDQLQKAARDEKWDRIKIVCTQPYDRYAQYGLSFIVLHSTEENAGSTSSLIDLGKFTLRPISPVSLSVGSLFAKRKELASDTSLKAAVAIREASSSAVNHSESPITKQKLFDIKAATPAKNAPTPVKDAKPKPRNRDDLLYKTDEDRPNKKIDEIIERRNNEVRERKAAEEEKRQKELEHKKKKDRGKNEGKGKVTNGRGSDTPVTSKTVENKKRYQETNTDESGSNKKPKVEKATKPFSELLKGVVFTISGIQNPDRADMRTMALEMGAKYKPDWDGSCTHLVCAFTNTPKFNQVRGIGKIVTKQWIPDCHSRRKKLPWRRYALDKREQKKPESEDEVWEKTQEKPKRSPKKTPAVTFMYSDTDDEIGNLQTVSDTDTEDEIERIQARAKITQKDKVKPSPSTSTASKAGHNQSNYGSSTKSDEIPAIFLQETDEEDLATRDETVDDDLLPNIFGSRVFYVDRDIEKEERLLIERYIVALDGILLKEPSDSVMVAVVKSDSVLLRTLCPDADLVLPDWIWECHNTRSLVPFNGYKL